MAGGALGSAFIPTFTGLLAKEEQKAAWKLASSIANLVLLVMTSLSVLAAIFAPQVVRYILAPGFAVVNPAKELLTIQLLRIQIMSSVIFGLSGLIMGILNAHRSFLLPALAPSMYSFGWILGVTILSKSLGIFGLAWGVVLGSILHLLIQIPKLITLPKQHYSLSFGLGEAYVQEVMRLMGPRLLGVAVVQLNFLLNTYLASMQPEGSLTGISLAFPLMIMPQAAIAQSVAIAALPTFSAQAALGKLEEMRSSLSATLRGVLLLAIPATVGLVLLRKPLVALIYQRGEFSVASTDLVAWALLWYAVGLVGHSVVEVVARAFYALHDTKTPVFVGIAAMTLNLGLSLLFSALFSSWGWLPHGGLALANSLATAIEMAGLLYLMRRKLGGLGGRQIMQGVLLACIGSAGMGVIIWALIVRFPNLSSLLVITGCVSLGGLVYALLLLAFHTNEIHFVLRLIRSRLTRADK